MLDEKVFSKKLAKLLSKFGITDEELRNSFIEDLKKEIEEGKEQPKVEEETKETETEIKKEPTEENKEQEKETEIEKTEDKEKKEEPKVEKETETEIEKDKVDVEKKTEGEPKETETKEDVETKVEDSAKTEQETKDQVQETLIGFGKRLDALEDLISKIADAKQESFGVDAKNNGTQSQSMSFQDRINRMRKGY